MIGLDTFSALAPVLGPPTKKLATPLPLFMAVSMIPKICDIRVSIACGIFVADKNWGFMLEAARIRIPV